MKKIKIYKKDNKEKIMKKEILRFLVFVFLVFLCVWLIEANPISIQHPYDIFLPPSSIYLYSVEKNNIEWAYYHIPSNEEPWDYICIAVISTKLGYTVEKYPIKNPKYKLSIRELLLWIVKIIKQ